MTQKVYANKKISILDAVRIVLDKTPEGWDYIVKDGEIYKIKLKKNE